MKHDKKKRKRKKASSHQQDEQFRQKFLKLRQKFDKQTEWPLGQPVQFVHVLQSGGRLTMTLVEHEDHILSRTNDLLGPEGDEAEEWVGCILDDLDEQFMDNDSLIMKPLVCIGRSGKAWLYQGGVHYGAITLQHAEILARYNQQQTPMEIFEEYNRGWFKLMKGDAQ